MSALPALVCPAKLRGRQASQDRCGGREQTDSAAPALVKAAGMGRVRARLPERKGWLQQVQRNLGLP
jgi:hypothetical protein